MSDAALVVRGGRMALDDLRSNAELTRRQQGYYRVSVWVADVANVEDLLGVDPPFPRLPHATVTRSRAGKIRKARFELRPSGPSYHCDVVISQPTREILNLVVALFEPPEPNPLGP